MIHVTPRFPWPRLCTLFLCTALIYMFPFPVPQLGNKAGTETMSFIATQEHTNFWIIFFRNVFIFHFYSKMSWFRATKFFGLFETVMTLLLMSPQTVEQREAFHFLWKVGSRVARWFIFKPKVPIWENFQGLRLEYDDICYGYLEFFVDIWPFYDNLVQYVSIWLFFSCFGVMHTEKSGNPGWQLDLFNLLVANRHWIFFSRVQTVDNFSLYFFWWPQSSSAIIFLIKPDPFPKICNFVKTVWLCQLSLSETGRSNPARVYIPKCLFTRTVILTVSDATAASDTAQK
jgi:hypothetical protein